MLNQRLYEVDFADSRHHKEVSQELRAAIEKFPQWPDDMLHALAIVGEEFGELTKDVLQFHYEPHKGKTEATIRAEAVQTLCMLHRFLNSLDTGRYTTPSITQHTV
jgi:hypothetical protein